MDAITEFRGPTRWLSNFARVDIIGPDGLVYRNTEAAYHAFKTDDPDERYLLRTAPTAKAAMDLAREGRITERPNWKEVRLDAMTNVNVQKFNQFDFALKLLRTRNAELIEGNDWGDTFWGVCNGVGENQLGKLLMRIRADLRSRWVESLSAQSSR